MEWIYSSFNVINDKVLESQGRIRNTFSCEQVLKLHYDNDFDYSAIVGIKLINELNDEVFNLTIEYKYILIDPNSKESSEIIPEIFYDALNRLNSEYVKRIKNTHFENFTPHFSPDFSELVIVFNVTLDRLL